MRPIQSTGGDSGPARPCRFARPPRRQQIHAAQNVVRPHGRKISPDQVGARVGQPVPQERAIVIFHGSATRLQFQNNSSRRQQLRRQRPGPVVRHQQDRRLSAGRPRQVERSADLHARLGFKAHPPAPAAQRLERPDRGRRIAGRNAQPAQLFAQLRNRTRPPESAAGSFPSPDRVPRTAAGMS
jgi:hypothetical protein